MPLNDAQKSFLREQSRRPRQSREELRRAYAAAFNSPGFSDTSTRSSVFAERFDQIWEDYERRMPSQTPSVLAVAANTVPEAHEEGLEYGDNAGDIAGANMAATIAASSTSSGMTLQRPTTACVEPLGSSNEMSWATFVDLNAQRETWQPLDDTNSHLRERLKEYTEYELKDVDNTGHCQFDALADQVEFDVALAVHLH